MKLRRNNFEIKWCEFTYSDQTTLIADPKLSLDAKRQKKNWILTFSGVFIMQKKQKKTENPTLHDFCFYFPTSQAMKNLPFMALEAWLKW